jgi:hypothetical protein
MPWQPTVPNFTSAQGQAWPTPDSQVDHHDGSEQQMPGNAPETGEPAGIEVKKAHACKACRQMKVRCELTSDSSPCRRCLKPERRCEPVQTPSRKRRSIPGSRVAQLEKKIDALTASLGEELARATRQQQELGPYPRRMEMNVVHCKWQKLVSIKTSMETLHTVLTRYSIVTSLLKLTQRISYLIDIVKK